MSHVRPDLSAAINSFASFGKRLYSNYERMGCVDRLQILCNTLDKTLPPKDYKPQYKLFEVTSTWTGSHT